MKIDALMARLRGLSAKSLFRPLKVARLLRSI